LNFVEVKCFYSCEIVYNFGGEQKEKCKNPVGEGDDEFLVSFDEILCSMDQRFPKEKLSEWWNLVGGPNPPPSSNPYQRLTGLLANVRSAETS
jgi:hypothetical protein